MWPFKSKSSNPICSVYHLVFTVVVLRVLALNVIHKCDGLSVAILMWFRSSVFPLKHSKMFLHAKVFFVHENCRPTVIPNLTLIDQSMLVSLFPFLPVSFNKPFSYFLIWNFRLISALLTFFLFWNVPEIHSSILLEVRPQLSSGTKQGC